MDRSISLIAYPGSIDGYITTISSRYLVISLPLPARVQAQPPARASAPYTCRTNDTASLGHELKDTGRSLPRTTRWRWLPAQAVVRSRLSASLARGMCHRRLPSSIQCSALGLYPVLSFIHCLQLPHRCSSHHWFELSWRVMDLLIRSSDQRGKHYRWHRPHESVMIRGDGKARTSLSILLENWIPVQISTKNHERQSSHFPFEWLTDRTVKLNAASCHFAQNPTSFEPT